MIFERTSLPLATTAAAVSSHDVSIPKINTTRLLHIQVGEISNPRVGYLKAHELNLPSQICHPVACAFSRNQQLSATVGRPIDHPLAIPSAADYAVLFAHCPDFDFLPLAVFPQRYRE